MAISSKEFKKVQRPSVVGSFEREVNNLVYSSNQKDVTPSITPKYKLSNPSQSIDEVNVPEVTEQAAEFVYNYYLQDERVSPPYSTLALPLSKSPRHVLLRWTVPRLSDFENNKESIEKKDNTGDYSLQGNSSKIISEDNFFNPSYVTHTFSNVDIIEQGASDLEKYSRLSRSDAESVYKMAKYQIQEVAAKGETNDKLYEKQTGELAESYLKLADFPKSSLGLRVYDRNNKLSDEDDLIRSISKSLSLTMKIHSTVIPDIFENSKVKSESTNLEALKIMHASAQAGTLSAEGLNVSPVKNDVTKTTSNYLTHPVGIVGYVIDRYLVTSEGFKKDSTFFVEDANQSTYVDRTVLYGYTYVYSIRAVASVKTLTYTADGSEVDISTLYVSSRPVSVPVECYEYTPPPEPTALKFVFDYTRRNLMIFWDMPVNPQRDVKQFQVFRRKSIKAPFELIAQYGFDKSQAGPGGTRYRTGEKVDANNIENMNDDLRYLVQTFDSPVYMHRDEDFTVDAETYFSSEYIYAVCAVDAHGMISNYSAQYHISFDPYKNRLIVRCVCDAGSPRQYPNMNLRLDAFKDVIKVSGDNARQMSVYFTPEYLKVTDGRDPNLEYKIVEAQTTNNNSYYVLQLINLDNQKSQLLKINIKDPQNLTLE